MSFNDIIGQETVKNQLVKLFQQNRLPHAILFTTKEGTGALGLALAFAQFVTCEKNHPAAANPSLGMDLFGDAPEEAPLSSEKITDSCGVCAGCVQAKKMAHPDIHFSYPVIRIAKKTKEKADSPFRKNTGEGKKNRAPVSTDFIEDWREFMQQQPFGTVFDWLQFLGAEQQQGNITADECNDIIQKLNLKSYIGEYKILIMWLPEYLGKEGNKLLKLIEEPPEKTLFILITEDESKLLPTLVSRCQQITIPPIKKEEIEKYLTQHYELTQEQAADISNMAGGNIREAIGLVEMAENNWEEILRKWLNAALSKRNNDISKTVQELAALGRERQKELLKFFIHILDQTLRYSILGDAGKMLSSEKDFVERFENLIDAGQIQSLAEEISNTMYYIERNANAKILFHALSIKIAYIIKHKIQFLDN